VYEKSEIILAELEATRKYVSDILRPRISSLISGDNSSWKQCQYIRVSADYGSIPEMFPEFRYKRAAMDSRAPLNQADTFESEIFVSVPTRSYLKDWQGLVTRNK